MHHVINGERLSYEKCYERNQGNRSNSLNLVRQLDYSVRTWCPLLSGLCMHNKNLHLWTKSIFGFQRSYFEQYPRPQSTWTKFGYSSVILIFFSISFRSTIWYLGKAFFSDHWPSSLYSAAMAAGRPIDLLGDSQITVEYKQTTVYNKGHALRCIIIIIVIMS